MNTSVLARILYTVLGRVILSLAMKKDVLFSTISLV